MKLSRIPGTERTVKHSFSFKQSTTDLLQKYVAFYEKTTGADVNLKDVTEQMLLDFMGDDKDFQRSLRQETAGRATPVAAPAPAAAEPAPAAPAEPVSGSYNSAL